MPRPKKAGAPEPKRRSRNGCWPCKARKVKCGEEKPRCINCERQGETCDYSIRLNWEGRSKKKPEQYATSTATATPSEAGSTSRRSSTFTTTEWSPTGQQPMQFSNYFAAPITPTNHRPARSLSETSNPTVGQPPAVHERRQSSNAVPQQNTGTLGNGFVPETHSPTVESQMARHSIDSQMHNGGQFHGGHSTSPIESPTYEAYKYGNGASIQDVGAAGSQQTMPPPYRGSVSTDGSSGFFADPMDTSHRSKRLRYSPKADSPSSSDGHLSNNTLSDRSTGMSSFATTPVTPGSSVMSDEQAKHAVRMGYYAYGQHGSEQFHSGSGSETPTRQYPITDEITHVTTYGYDCGEPDVDSPKNDDSSAVKIFSPPAMYISTQSGPKAIAFEKGGYYAKPVPIKIPKHLEPLPRLLTENPINLLYFHHFMNHTARILVPHDCEQNPFRNVLPEMAVKDDNLLCLMLAFSASHRARLLDHKEPSNRIATWVQDVFPKLRQALADNRVTDANLTTAIMLASLEIICPNAFEVPVSWQTHLQTARQMIIARGGPHAIKRSDKVPFFLSRWFAYLDVIGSLSGNKNDKPLGPNYWTSDPDDQEEWQIDCLFGFTTRYLGILSHIALLAKQCESERFDEAGNVRENWRPSPDVVQFTETLRRSLQEGREHVYRPCNHRAAGDNENEQGWDSLEIYATNEMFHWAGLIHLSRRVLGKSTWDSEVQIAVQEIVGALSKVRYGSTAEACLLFPMFTAGCDAIQSVHRKKIIERLVGMEGFGMLQVKKARTLMQEVWETGKPWETLVSGEFFG